MHRSLSVSALAVLLGACSSVQTSQPTASVPEKLKPADEAVARIVPA